MTRVRVAKRSDIPPGGMRVVTVGGTRVALCDVEGKLYAVEDLCTHDDGPLGEGALRGAELECPRHGGRFDVRTGSATRMPAVAPVRMFPVSVEGEDVVLEEGNYSAPPIPSGGDPSSHEEGAGAS